MAPTVRMGPRIGLAIQFGLVATLTAAAGLRPAGWTTGTAFLILLLSVYAARTFGAWIDRACAPLVGPVAPIMPATLAPPVARPGGSHWSDRQRP